jgi:hypothetical protein
MAGRNIEGGQSKHVSCRSGSEGVRPLRKLNDVLFSFLLLVLGLELGALHWLGMSSTT